MLIDNVNSGIGLISSLACDTANACGAARAGLSRAEDLSLLNLSQYGFFGKENLDGFPPIKGHACPLIGEGFTGVGKVVELGCSALNSMGSLYDIALINNKKCGVFIGLNDFELVDRFEEKFSESHYDLHFSNSEEWYLNKDKIVSSIFNGSQFIINSELKTIYYGGHAVVGEILCDAIVKLNNDDLDCVIVGAVDSNIDPQMLISAASLDLLFTEENPVGFLPGEAAGFLLVRQNANSEIILGNGLKLDYVNHKKFEQGLFDEPIPKGKELASLILEAINECNLNTNEIKQIIIDGNGLEWHAYEWGFTQVFLKEAGIDFSLATEWLPASSFGEVGVTMGMASLGMSEQGYLRGYFTGITLIILSSWNGSRSVILVSEGQH